MADNLLINNQNAQPEQADALPTWNEFESSAEQERQAALPTWEEFEKKQTPTLQGAFGNYALETAKASIPFMPHNTEELSEAQRLWAQKQPSWNIVKAFGSGYAEAVGRDTGLSEETRNAIREFGVLEPMEQSRSTTNNALMDAYVVPFARGLYEGVRRPAMTAVELAAELGDVAMTTAMTAPYEGYQEAARQVGEEVGSPSLGRTLAELPDAFAGDIYNFPHPPAALPRDVARMKANRVLEGEAEYFGVREPSPQAAKDIEAAALVARESEALPVAAAPEGPPPTIHETARVIAPEVFGEYDDLVKKRDDLGAQLRDLSYARAEDARTTAPHNAAIAELQARMETANPRMTKKYQERLDALEAENQAYIAEKSREITPEMNRIRGLYTQADYRMRDLAPEVGAAYREAEARMPAPEPVTPAQSVRAVETAQDVEKSLEVPRMAEERKLEEAMPGEAVPAPAPVTIDPLIHTDVKGALVAAGRGAEEAEAAATLVATHYEARAARFEGKRGTAMEMYRADAPAVQKGGKGKSAKGKYRPAKAEKDARSVITLMESADSSTFIHETGHHWLEELTADALHEFAPQRLKDDAATVRNWLGVKEGTAITRRQHEKFARAFERYMMEGVAPSKQLAGVFAQFKQWLTSLYRTVERLKAPISDDIRDVFDRFLSNTPERTVVAEDALAAAPETTMMGEAAAMAPDSVVPPAEAGRAAEAQPPAATGEVAAPVMAEPAPITKPAAESVQESALDNPSSIIKPAPDLIDKAGNIRMENLTSNQDVRDVMRQAANDTDNFSEARFGTVTDADVEDLANAMGVKAKELNIEKLREMSVNDGVPLAVRIKVGRRMLVEASQQALDAMNTAARTGADKDLLAFAEARNRHLMIAETVSAVTEEWGRAGRAFRDITGESMKNAEAVTELFQRTTGLTPEQVRKLAENGKLLDSPAKVAKFLQDSKKPSFWAMAIEYRRAAMLWRPRSLLKNLVTNAAMAVNSVAETALASGVGKILRSEDRVYAGEAKARLFGIYEGTLDGWETAKSILTEDSSFVKSKLSDESVHVPAIPGKTGYVVRTPFRVLAATDELFKSIGSRQELNALAYRQATKEGLTGDAWSNRVSDILDNPTEDMLAQAKAHAENQTLTQDLGQGAAGGFQKHVLRRSYLLQHVIPFYKTNINSLKYFVGDRTPLGIFSERVRNNVMGKNGTIARDTQIAKLTLGSAYVGLAWTLADMGFVTGAAPEDKAEREAFYRQGKKPYSINVGGYWVDYTWLQGFSVPFGMAVDMNKVWKAKTEDDAEIDAKVAASIAVLSEKIMNISSLQGVSDTVASLRDPLRYGDQWFKSFVGSFVPGIVTDTASSLDPYMRQVNDILIAPLQKNIPFARNELPPKYDVWGQPLKNQAQWHNVVNPIFTSRENNDPVEQRLAALRFYPSMPSKKIRGVELTTEQYDMVTKITGRAARQQLEAIVTQPGFAQMPDRVQIEVIKHIYDGGNGQRGVREMARSIVMQKYPEIGQKALQNKLDSLK